VPPNQPANHHCDGQAGTPGKDLQAGQQIAIGSSTQITWTPACLVQQVLVFENFPPSVGGPQLRWGVRTPSGGMASPIRYGEVPSGAQVILAAEPLVSGHPYLVELSMSELVGNSNIVGQRGFVR
jgi:hypothetical protein